jgi:Uma2 family endonuclease
MEDGAVPLLKRPVSLAEFLAWEQGQSARHEYRGGRIRMMTGGTRRNTRLATTIAGTLNARLRGGPCFAYAENLQVALSQAEAGYYPDVVVDCGAYDPNALTAGDPTVVFEVLSPCTRDTDFSEKVPDYRDSGVKQIVLVEPDEPLLHVWTYDHGRWRETRIAGLEASLALPALGFTLPLAEMYEGA